MDVKAVISEKLHQNNTKAPTLHTHNVNTFLMLNLCTNVNRKTSLMLTLSLSLSNSSNDTLLLILKLIYSYLNITTTISSGIFPMCVFEYRAPPLGTVYKSYRNAPFLCADIRFSSPPLFARENIQCVNQSNKFRIVNRLTFNSCMEEKKVSVQLTYLF